MIAGPMVSASGRLRLAFLSSGAMLAAALQPSKAKAMGAAAAIHPVPAAPAVSMPWTMCWAGWPKMSPTTSTTTSGATLATVVMFCT